MDDSCAVCADDLEWVAYGSCCHREVCSTCVVRLRFVLGDRRCCICKTESPIIFVTKALGGYTRVVSDFSVFPENPSEGQVGQFWYHEDTQAVFDDADHYRMIKAMCRLSCSVCDKSSGQQGSESTKRRYRYRSIEQLKGHLFHVHKLFMCSLCLEGRKVFICEQKLYTRSQLTQHTQSGDSEVDGSESERGGFMGHPMCEFCRNPFYGDNELYMHMSREHYTCHICQRQHPGQYDYYKSYDDLEVHFCQEHFLCEDEACLAKKFVVFQTEAEMKRHNGIEHGGRMSRSKRNAILQIPTSFRFRRNEEEQRRRRGRGSRPEPSDNQLSVAIQASLDSAVASGRVSETSVAQPVTKNGETVQGNDAIGGSVESLTIISGSEASSKSTTQSSRATTFLEESSFPSLVDRELPEPSSRYAQALIQSSSGATRLGEAFFPPLPGANNNPKSAHGLESQPMNTLAARLQQSNRVPVMTDSSLSKQSGYLEVVPSTSQVGAPPSHRNTSSSSSSSQLTVASKPVRENGFLSPLSANSAWNMNNTNMMNHSASAPNLAEAHLANQAVSTKFSAMNANQQSTKNHSLPTVPDFHAANKSLVERIRVGLGKDEDRYAAFKGISAEYRQGLIDTYEYLSYVEQIGLSHLVLELARLCPDVQKQKELIDAYNANIQHKSLQKNFGSSGGNSIESKLSKKGKGKSVAHVENGSISDALADSILDTVRRLQLSDKPQEDKVEVLSKDGYLAGKGKLPLFASAAGANSGLADMNSSEKSANGASQSLTDTTRSSSFKQRKKTSKFTRIRLGDVSATPGLDLSHDNANPDRTEREPDRPSDGPPVQGAWRNGGGQRLFAK